MKPFDLSGKRVFVAGHRGLVGSAIVRRLAQESCTVLTAGRAELDLRRQEPVERWLEEKRPDAVFFAAAKVGGILANSTIRRSSFTTTSPSKRTSSTPPIWPASRSSCSWGRLASIRSLRLSPSRKMRS